MSAAERHLAVRAVVVLAFVRLAVRRISISRLRSWVDGVGRSGWAADPLAIRRAVQRAARTLPGSSCLAQSLAAEVLLRASGHPARLTIGVAGPAVSAADLDAHAWVESGGVLVAGDGPLERYRELVTFGTRS